MVSLAGVKDALVPQELDNDVVVLFEEERDNVFVAFCSLLIESVMSATCFEVNCRSSCNKWSCDESSILPGLCGSGYSFR